MICAAQALSNGSKYTAPASTISVTGFRYEVKAGHLHAYFSIMNQPNPSASEGRISPFAAEFKAQSCSLLKLKKPLTH